MNHRHHAWTALAALLAATTALAGCGLKGALTQPEKTTNMVIRSQGTPAAQGAAESAPADGGTAPAEQPVSAPTEPPLPPPDLPHSNSGTPR